MILRRKTHVLTPTATPQANMGRQTAVFNGVLVHRLADRFGIMCVENVTGGEGSIRLIRVCKDSSAIVAGFGCVGIFFHQVAILRELEHRIFQVDSVRQNGIKRFMK
jgi:hypothetical protein